VYLYAHAFYFAAEIVLNFVFMQLGPGQYTLDAPKFVVPAAVPFHTGKQKILNEATTYAAYSPGAHSYSCASAT
jgi:hypothetical protein